MFWIIANHCAYPMIYSSQNALINKLNYGILHQLPGTSGHIKSKQQTFTLNHCISVSGLALSANEIAFQSELFEDFGVTFP